MDKKLILAVAGSGKTYKIANSIDENKKNIIFTFNVANVENLKVEIINRFGYIPPKTLVMTFHKFRYDFIIKPKQYTLGKELKGINIIKKPAESEKGANRNYIKDSEIGHYIEEDKVFSSRISKLIIKRNLIDLDYLSKFFDNVYIDEFQDFEDYDFKVIKEISKASINFYGYGDYYQAGVSMNCLMKKVPYNKCDTIEHYKKNIDKAISGIYFDGETLKKSRRCGDSITKFINEKFGIQFIESENINNTEINYVDIQNIPQLINDDVKFLVWDKRAAESLNIVNFNTWSKSKGDTYEKVCVVLTPKTTQFLNGTENLEKTTQHKLYVALTRATEKVYLLER